MIPDSWNQFALYESRVDYTGYNLAPIIGAFEVSYNGVLLFSKFESGLWPNIKLVAKKCYLARQSLLENFNLNHV